MQRQLPGLVGDLEAGVVGDVLAEGQLAIDEIARERREGGVFGDQPLRLRGKARLVARCPPVAQVAVAVELAALVVEAVADLVADHHANAAVVQRVVSRRVERRRLQEGRREDDLVHRRVVVGIDGLRRHRPFVVVDGLAEPVDRPLPGEFICAHGIADRVPRFDAQRRVVDPAVRIAHLGRELRELGERFAAGRRAHPVARRDALAVGREQVDDQRLDPGLRLRREPAGHVTLAEGLAERMVDEPDPAFPARAVLGPPADHGAGEGELGVDEVVAQQRREREQEAAARVGFPGAERPAREQRREAGEIAGLGDDDVVGAAGQARRDDERGPGKRRRDGRKVGEVDPVVGLHRIAVLHLRPLHRGDLGLERHHGARVGASRALMREGEEPGQAVDVALAHLAELRVAGIEEIVAVRQTEPALLQGRHPARRIARVLVDRDADRRGDADPVEAGEQRDQAVDVRHGVDRLQRRGERRGPGGLDRGLVHEAREERRDLSRIGVAGLGGGLLDEVAQPSLGLVDQGVEGAGARPVGGDRRGRQPAPVGMAVQVVLRPDRRVDRRRIDARGRRGERREHEAECGQRRGPDPQTPHHIDTRAAGARYMPSPGLTSKLG